MNPANDRIRVSDAERDRVAERLREHYAEGRLTAEELDERITAALSAKTYADLRRVMADLPDPEAAVPGLGQLPAERIPRPVYVYRRGPRLLPLALLGLLAAMVLPGAGWMFVGMVQILLLFAVVAGIVSVITATSAFRSHGRRYRQPRYPGAGYRADGYPNQWCRWR